MDIAICALTYKRPEGLRRLLDGLDGLTFSGPRPEIRIVIVDNDPRGSARAAYEQTAAVLRWPIEYVAERRPRTIGRPEHGIARGTEQPVDLLH